LLLRIGSRMALSTSRSDRSSPTTPHMPSVDPSSTTMTWSASIDSTQSRIVPTSLWPATIALVVNSAGGTDHVSRDVEQQREPKQKRERCGIERQQKIKRVHVPPGCRSSASLFHFIRIPSTSYMCTLHRGDLLGDPCCATGGNVTPTQLATIHGCGTRFGSRHRGRGGPPRRTLIPRKSKGWMCAPDLERVQWSRALRRSA
jgi:hypothetical protein